jgi:hypothetical protein
MIHQFVTDQQIYPDNIYQIKNDAAELCLTFKRPDI